MKDTEHFASGYAKQLIGQATPVQHEFIDSQMIDHPAVSWRRSGAMDLTGLSSQPGLMSPAPLTGCADGALLAFKSLIQSRSRKAETGLEALRGASLLTERANSGGLLRNGKQSPGGACRLVNSRDGRLAINLPRDDDWPLAQAWLETGLSGWSDVQDEVNQKKTTDLLERARMLGLAVSDVKPMSGKPFFGQMSSRPPVKQPGTTPLVLDLSALWAGPLAASLLRLAGGRVIKVESEARPDGARKGDANFYDLLNQGKESVQLDLSSAVGVRVLKKLIAQADIVVESARPRGLLQLGIDANQCVAENTGLVWVSITAYGREMPYGNWIGYGDDVAVAAGLTDQLYRASGETAFAGDAIADPLTGIHAALAAYSGFLSGAGGLLDISMHAVTKYCATIAGEQNLIERYQIWTTLAKQDSSADYAHRQVQQPAALPGVDTAAVIADLAS